MNFMDDEYEEINGTFCDGRCGENCQHFVIDCPLRCLWVKAYKGKEDFGTWVDLMCKKECGMFFHQLGDVNPMLNAQTEGFITVKCLGCDEVRTMPLNIRKCLRCTPWRRMNTLQLYNEEEFTDRDRQYQIRYFTCTKCHYQDRIGDNAEEETA